MSRESWAALVVATVCALTTVLGVTSGQVWFTPISVLGWVSGMWVFVFREKRP